MPIELTEYIATPLTPGDEVNVAVGGLGIINVIKAEVLRVEYNYFGQEGMNKVLVKSFDSKENLEFDTITQQYYLGILIQQI